MLDVSTLFSRKRFVRYLASFPLELHLVVVGILWQQISTGALKERSDRTIPFPSFDHDMCISTYHDEGVASRAGRLPEVLQADFRKSCRQTSGSITVIY